MSNLFNLALYHVARGNAEEAEARYREALVRRPHAAGRHSAVTDLEQYLTLFPGDELVGRMIALLAIDPDSK